MDYLPSWTDLKHARQRMSEALPAWRQEVRETPCKSYWDIVRGAAAANTFRAFQKSEKQPSVVFRCWALCFLQSGRFYDLALHPERFDSAHSTIVREFSEYWECLEGEPLKYGAATKLLNLLVRDACESRLNGPEFERIMNHIHVPLDEYVLTLTKAFIEPALKDAHLEHLPSSLSMGAVATEEQYRTIQCTLRSLAKSVDAPPSVIDYIAWNKTHPDDASRQSR